MVLSQVQATATGQPIKVPQFVPPPRLTPRPTFQPQVRSWKPRLRTPNTSPAFQPLLALLFPVPLPPSPEPLPSFRPVCGPRDVIRSLTSRGQECAKANTHALLVALKHCLLCAASTHLSSSSLCFLYFLTDLWAGCFTRSPACVCLRVCVSGCGCVRLLLPCFPAASWYFVFLAVGVLFCCFFFVF